MITSVGLTGEFWELPGHLFQRRIHPKMSRKANTTTAHAPPASMRSPSPASVAISGMQRPDEREPDIWRLHSDVNCASRA